MSARAGAAAPQRTGVIKIHSHSTQFSFWTVPLDANTRAADVVNVVANKIMLPPEHVFLYEVGDNKGLLIGTALRSRRPYSPRRRAQTGARRTARAALQEVDG